jgi:hypothetical protein
MTRARRFTIATVATMGVVGGAILGCKNPSPLVPQPPLKIRGGAMTLRYPKKTDGSSPWSPYQNGYCAPLNTSSGATLQVIADPDPTGPPPSPATIPLTGAWSAALYALNESGTGPDPSHGITLSPISNCNGQNGVSAQPFGLNSDFYPGELTSTGTVGKRYRRKTGCSDEDLCERLGSIHVQGYSDPPCENGECLVKIVVP